MVRPRKPGVGRVWRPAVILALLMLYEADGGLWGQAAAPGPAPPPPPPGEGPPPAVAPAPPPPAPAPDQAVIPEKSTPEKPAGDKEIDARVTRDRGGAQPIRQKEE